MEDFLCNSFSISTTATIRTDKSVEANFKPFINTDAWWR